LRSKISAAHHALAELQNSDGGWGYERGGQSFLEPTAWAMQALSTTDETSAAVDSAAGFIAACQSTDGSWGIFPGDSGGTWMVALAALALGNTSRREQALVACRSLLGLEDGFRQQPDPEAQAVFTRVFGLKMGLRGWPWYPNNASWVEPTAYAVWALCANGFIRSTPRITAALAYLDDRAFSTGGWNYGNPRVFSAHLSPLPIPTAAAVIALLRAGRAPNSPTLAKGVEALSAMATTISTDRARAFTALALLEASLVPGTSSDLGKSVQRLLDPLRMKRDAWLERGRPLDVALAALALHAQVRSER